LKSKRFIKNRVRRGKKEPFQLEMTSLLDIMVILLVFLIKSYSSTETAINIPNTIDVPFSVSQDVSAQAVMVQMSKDHKIWVDDALVADLNVDGRRAYGKDQKLTALYDFLVAKKEDIENLAKQAQGAKPFTGLVNLVMDKALPYRFIKEIMYTATEAGYKEFKFIVIAEEK